MRSLMHATTRAVTTIAIVALPAFALAQSQAQTAGQANPAAEHLAAARAALNKVLNAPAPGGEAFKKLSELKTEYVALEKAASAASPEWGKHYQAIDRVLTDLIGAQSASGVSGAVGTSGRASSVHIEANMATNLQEFRTELNAFSAAMSAVAPAPGVAPSAPATSSASTPSSTASSTSAPAPTPSPAPSAPAAPTPTAPASPAPAPSGPPPAPTSGTTGTAGTTPTITAPSSTQPSSPSAPATMTAPSTTPSPAMPATSDATVVAQLDAVSGMVDSVLKANAAQSGDKVPVDRAMLEHIKAQIDQIKQSLKKQ